MDQLRLPASRRRGEPKHAVGIASNPGSVCGRDRGCGVTPVRWTKDDIARSILSFSAQNA
ncbi:hypothetical protein [Candidatus Alkanophaga liquidiphilum]